MRELILVRHGQTACSTRNVYCGRCDVSLDDTGRATAQALARHLGGGDWSALYASPLARAQQTIAPLAKRARMPVQTLAALSELHYGTWDGYREDALRAQDPDNFSQWEAAPDAHAPPGGERAADVALRVRGAVEQMKTQHPGGRVLAVSHKATLRILLGELLGIPLKDFRRRLAQPLGGISVIAFTPRGPLLRCVGDISYAHPHPIALEQSP